MPEETKVDQVETQGTLENTAVNPDNSIPNIEELTEKIRSEIEQQKHDEIAGLNRANTKLANDLKKRMTEEESIKAEAENRQKSFLEKYTKLAVKSVGLDEAFADLINGIDEDEIDDKIAKFHKVKSAIESEKDKVISKLEDEIKVLKAGESAPKAGQTTAANTISRTDFDAKTADEKMAFFKAGGKVEN